MDFKRLLAVLLMLSMVLLAGCSKTSESPGKGAVADEGTSDIGDSNRYDSEGASSQETKQNGQSTQNEYSYSSEKDSSQETPLTENQKLIRKLRLTAETEALGELLSQLEQKVKALGGYMESREVNNNDAYNRQAELIIRVPAASLDQFTEAVEENVNVTSISETTENITLSYVAEESRVKALETEQTRLLELLEKANNMTEILQIEDRLTEVRTELEKVTSQLRLYDNQVAYGTVYLSLLEVKVYTEDVPEGFWERIGMGLAGSVKTLITGFKELLIFLTVTLPYLAVFATVGGSVLFIVKRRKKKKITKANKEDKE